VASVDAQQRANASEQIAIESQRSQTQRNVQNANNNREVALAGCSIGMILMAIIFPPLIPVVCCIGTSAAYMADDMSDNATAELMRLQEWQTRLANLHIHLEDSLAKATRLQQALPTLLEKFRTIYDFWNSVDTAVKAIRVQGQSKLMYKRYALAWGALQEELGRNAEQLLAF